MRSLGEVIPHQLPLVMDPSRPAETVECLDGGWPRMTKTQAHRFVDDYSTRLRPERKQALRNQVGEAWLGDEHGLNALEILANDEIDLYLRRAHGRAAADDTRASALGRHIGRLGADRPALGVMGHRAGIPPV